MLRTLIPWFTALVVIAADRATKIAIMTRLTPGSFHEVFPGLGLTHVHNRGIAFSLFADGGPMSRLLLHMVIVVAVVVIMWMVVRHGHHHPLAGLSFGLILGGALGNLTDRVLFGWVVDFIHVWVKFGGNVWSWPDFNIADSAISVGAILLIATELFSSREEAPDAPDSD